MALARKRQCARCLTLARHDQRYDPALRTNSPDGSAASSSRAPHGRRHGTGNCAFSSPDGCTPIRDGATAARSHGSTAGVRPDCCARSGSASCSAAPSTTSTSTTASAASPGNERTCARQRLPRRAGGNIRR